MKSPWKKEIEDQLEIARAEAGRWTARANALEEILRTAPRRATKRPKDPVDPAKEGGVS